MRTRLVRPPPPLLLPPLLALLACPSARLPDDPSIAGSCEAISTLGVCVQYSASSGQSQEWLSSACAAAGGTFDPGACPSLSLLGTCRSGPDLRHYYDTGHLTPGDARRDCEETYLGRFAPVSIRI